MEPSKTRVISPDLVGCTLFNLSVNLGEDLVQDFLNQDTFNMEQEKYKMDQNESNILKLKNNLQSSQKDYKDFHFKVSNNTLIFFLIKNDKIIPTFRCLLRVPAHLTIFPPD